MPEQHQRVHLSSQHGVQVIALRGEFDLASIDELEAAADAAAGALMPVVVDLTAASFIDSSVIAFLVATHDRVAAAGLRFVVAIDPDSEPARVLQLGLLGTVLPVVNGVAGAIVVASVAADRPA
jgi:anti-sigma B factor antagonist